MARFNMACLNVLSFGMWLKPSELFDRDREWSRLVDFVQGGDRSSAQLGLMYGRRRQGKTLLATGLCEAVGGFYWEALDTESTANLEGVSDAWSIHVGHEGRQRFASWSDAFATMLRAGADGFGPVVAIDEVQRVIAKAPELPSIIQHLLGSGGLRKRAGATRLLLCGSAFGELRRLLDGDAPLRGRATLELVIEPFAYRTAASYWGLDANPAAALRLHALVGGTPAYRALANGDTPGADGDVDAWVVRRLLEPSSSLFREGRIVVGEDSQLADRQLYWGLLSAVADGAKRWMELQAALGVSRGSLQHALTVATDAGWLVKVSDPLRRNRFVYELVEPMVRFHRLVIERHGLRLTRRPAQEVWVDARPDVAARIVAPHLESIAREWLLAHASAATAGGILTEVGPSEIDGVGQIDIVGVEATAVGGRRTTVLGEVKSTDARVGLSQLERLDKAALGMGEVKRLLVSLAGFTTDLERAARRRSDVELVDITRLYSGD